VRFSLSGNGRICSKLTPLSVRLSPYFIGDLHTIVHGQNVIRLCLASDHSSRTFKVYYFTTLPVARILASVTKEWVWNTDDLLLTGKTLNTRKKKKPVPVPLCPPNVPSERAWDSTGASVVAGRWINLTHGMTTGRELQLYGYTSAINCRSFLQQLILSDWR
jgi:hypothetical protein